MILADKITELRKKAGWSQEELAAQLGVSRQSVSKWEGAQSVPDMEKILQLSNLFGVSTDYLLKDEITQPETKTASSITAQTAAGVRHLCSPKRSSLTLQPIGKWAFFMKLFVKFEYFLCCNCCIFILNVI